MEFDSSIQAVTWFDKDRYWKINYFDDARGIGKLSSGQEKFLHFVKKTFGRALEPGGCGGR